MFDFIKNYEVLLSGSVKNSSCFGYFYYKGILVVGKFIVGFYVGKNVVGYFDDSMLGRDKTVNLGE